MRKVCSRREFVKIGALFVPVAFGLIGLTKKSRGADIVVNGPTQFPGGSFTSFVTSPTLGADVTGNNGYELGMEIAVGASPISVKQLGLWVIAGNTGTRAIRIYDNIFTGSPGVVASVSVNANGQPAGFLYGNATPTLSASTTYGIAADFTTGSDHSYDVDTVLAHTAVATITGAIYRASGGVGAFAAAGSADHCYVPLNFKY